MPDFDERMVLGSDGARLLSERTGHVFDSGIGGSDVVTEDAGLVALLIQQTVWRLDRLRREYPTGECGDLDLKESADQLERVASVLRTANDAFSTPE